MTSSPAIRVNKVSKYFVFWQNKPRDLKRYLINIFKSKKNNSIRHELTVLRDVSFDIFPGEFVGIMGKNGAGKSTILKVISGIYAPNRGDIAINGSIAPVLELGAGFADELSGYENIFLNASILGFGKSRTEEMINSIIEFSELKEHIYAPVRNYSSGMLVRLAFSIACHMDASILLFDEVLAVGDVGFQKKCLLKINELYKQNKAIILITHDPEQVRKHCSRCIVIRDHQVLFDGDAATGADLYLKEFC